jgi:ABC-type multidrug transport system ATPase subunit
MKRRLSVAISFVGDPLVVFLDEPSTGLDPASRRGLWDVVRSNKAGRGVLLTTHSMEEAQVSSRFAASSCGQLLILCRIRCSMAPVAGQ